MVTPVTVVAEQQLVVVLRGAAQGAGLTLNTLPGVLPDTHHHVLGELQAARVS